MVIKKQVKEYSGRQRISLNKADGFKTNDEVYIMSADEYNQFKDNLFDLSSKLDKSIEAKETAIETATKMNENVTDAYKIQLKDKDNKIKQLENELNNIRAIASKFLIQISSLGAFDIFLRHKHRDLIDDFQQSIWISRNNVEILESEDGQDNMIPDADVGNSK
jgi:uncharacterized protein YdcH (DUF465 family)